MIDPFDARASTSNGMFIYHWLFDALENLLQAAAGRPVRAWRRGGTENGFAMVSATAIGFRQDAERVPNRRPLSSGRHVHVGDGTAMLPSVRRMALGGREERTSVSIMCRRGISTVKSTTKAAIAITLLTVILLSIWLGARFQRAESHVDGAAANLIETTAPPKSSEVSEGRGDRELQLKERVRLLEEELARKTAEAEDLARQAAVIDRLADEVIVSLGTVEDVGRRTGEMLGAVGEWSALKDRPDGSLTPEESRRLLALERQRASALGALREIEEFQNDPDEYAAFFKGLFEATAQLTSDDSMKVEEFMRRRAQEMADAGLNAAREPEDPDEEQAWEARRDAFNQVTTEGLRSILPPGTADQIGLDDALLELLEGDFDRSGAWAH